MAVGGVPDIITPGRTGFLAPRGDEEGLVNALLRLTEDPALLHSTGERARTFVATNHAPPNVFKTLERLYRAALDHGARTGT